MIFRKIFKFQGSERRRSFSESLFVSYIMSSLSSGRQEPRNEKFLMQKLSFCMIGRRDSTWLSDLELQSYSEKLQKVWCSSSSSVTFYKKIKPERLKVAESREEIPSINAAELMSQKIERQSIKLLKAPSVPFITVNSFPHKRLGWRAMALVNF